MATTSRYALRYPVKGDSRNIADIENLAEDVEAVIYNQGISDGVPPSSSPNPGFVPGPGWILCVWNPITNHDRVTYEVHMSRTPGFTPSSATLCGTTTSNEFFIRTDPTLSNVAINPNQQYTLEVVAKDADGYAPRSGIQVNGYCDPLINLTRNTVRPSSPAKGMMHLYETDERVEFYDGITPGWKQLATLPDAATQALGLNILRGLSRTQGKKSGCLLAETIPWELALLSANSKPTPQGTSPTSGRITFQAIYLEQGQIVDGMQCYCTAALTSAVGYNLGVWSFDGTMWTCQVVTGGVMNTGTGFRGGLTGLGWTVPASGIYYAHHYFNGTVGSGGAILQYTDIGAVMIVPGAFTGAQVNAGFSSLNWPRVAAINSAATAPVVGQTRLFSDSVPVSNQPWVGVLGTIL